MKITKWKSLFEQQYKIYCDMDGTLVDFNDPFEKQYNIPSRDFKDKYGEEEMWRAIEKIDHFFLKMPWLNGSQQMWNIIKKFNPTILTTPADTVEQCKQDKLDWVRKNLGDYKVIFSADKFNYANPNSILIDDNDENIEQWRNAGGKGIKFVNPEQAIKILGNMGVI